MERKNNFLLYTENIEEIEDLSFEQRGVLLTALLYYQDGRELPEMDALTRMVFKFLKKRIDRDNEAYAKKCEQNKTNGSKGGRPKKAGGTSNQTVCEKTERFLENPKKAEYDIDIDIDTDTDIDSGCVYTQSTADKEQRDIQQVVESWNKIPHTVNVEDIRPMTRRYDELRLCLGAYGADKVLAAVQKVADSPWLSNRGHVVFKNYINMNVIPELLEGAYDVDYSKKGVTESDGYEFDYDAFVKDHGTLPCNGSAMEA